MKSRTISNQESTILADFYLRLMYVIHEVTSFELIFKLTPLGNTTLTLRVCPPFTTKYFISHYTVASKLTIIECL